MEKTIVSKMGLFDILAMLLPGLVILWGVEIINPSWIQYVYNFPGMCSEFWRNTAFIFAAFLVGGMWHTIMDTLWHICHLRNCPWLLRLSIRFLQFNHNKAYPIDRLENLRTSATIEKDYYENYEAVYEKCGSKLSAVDKQVVMFRNLILPAPFLMYAICKNGVNVAPIFANHLWWWVIGVGVLFFIFAIARQMRVYYVYYDYFAFMKTPEVKEAGDSKTFIQKFRHWLSDNLGFVFAFVGVAVILWGIVECASYKQDIDSWTMIFSFLISLFATFFGVFLIYANLRPRLKIDSVFTKNPNGYLCVRVTNNDIFKAYNLTAYLDFCRTDEEDIVRTKKIELKRDAIGVIRNCFSKKTDKEYVFKSKNVFEEDEKYDRVRFRVIASHQISNVQLEFEKYCKIDEIK